MTTLALPTFEDVRAAAQRLHGHAHRTPVLTSTRLDEALGAIRSATATLAEALRRVADRLREGDAKGEGGGDPQ